MQALSDVDVEDVLYIFALYIFELSIVMVSALPSAGLVLAAVVKSIVEPLTEIEEFVKISKSLLLTTPAILFTFRIVEFVISVTFAVIYLSSSSAKEISAFWMVTFGQTR